MNVIIDIDDTIANMREPLSKSLNKFTNKKIHWTQWKNNNLEEVYGVTLNEFLDILHDDKIIENMTPHKESKEFLNTLKQYGFNIIMLSARKWHNNGYSVTKAMLDEYGLIYDDIILCDISDNKSDIIKSNAINNVAFTVDDSARHCYNYSIDNNINNSFVYDMPWNRTNVGNSTRIYNLTDIFTHLKDL